MKIIIHWVVSALTILITAYILPGVHVDGLVAALIVAVVLGAINLILVWYNPRTRKRSFTFFRENISKQLSVNVS